MESLARINSDLKLNLPSDDFLTVNGWVLDLFGRIPKVGEKLTWDLMLIEIVDADKKKVNRIKITKNKK